MKKIIGGAVALVFAVAGYFVWLELQKTESTDDAQIDGKIVAISARVPGHVLEVPVEDQQHVKKGDVLFRLDPKDFQVAVEKAKADLADAIATVQTLHGDVPLTGATTSGTLSAAEAAKEDATAAVAWNERQLRAAQARVQTAQANVKVSEANEVKAAQDVARYKALVAKDEISKQQYDQAVATDAAAKASVEAAKAAVIEAQQGVAAAEAAVDQAKAKVGQAVANVQTAATGPQQVAIAESRVKAAQAKVAQYRAALEQSELNLSYTTVVAPADGIIGRKTIEVGQNVSAGQQMLAIVSLEDVWVTANFKETQLRRMKIGQTVEIEVDANGQTYQGTIERIAGASGARFSLLPPENATGNFVKVVQRIPVRIALNEGQNEDHELRPGMSVTPSVRVQ